MSDSLQSIADALASHPAVREKINIHHAYQPAAKVCGDVVLGDDAAAIPDPRGGHLLFAAEGILDSFVEDDPWFAGYSAVMVNLSDIAAMGGEPIAITDILWAPNDVSTQEIWEGMRAASEAYQVPIVGGHTTRSSNDQLHLAAAVMGRAGEKLLTSFDAKVGDDLMIAIDMKGAYRGDKSFWNASTTTSPEILQRNLALLSEIAEAGLSKASKDISNGGLIGTLAMLCHCSKVGAELNFESIPRPENTSWLKWLTSFPSYGYLLSTPQSNRDELIELFENHGVTAAKIGTIQEHNSIKLVDSLNQQSASISL